MFSFHMLQQHNFGARCSILKLQLCGGLPWGWVCLLKENDVRYFVERVVDCAWAGN